MEIKAKPQCPLNNFEPCKELECAWFLKVVGAHPQTDKEIEDWGCSISWLPIIMIENSKQQHHTGSAIESFRNEMVKSNQVSHQIMLAKAGLTPGQTYIEDKND
jgi:hypothetical protein